MALFQMLRNVLRAARLGVKFCTAPRAPPSATRCSAPTATAVSPFWAEVVCLSTTRTACLSTTPKVLMEGYDHRLYTKTIKNQRKAYFIDLLESNRGNLYMKLTEASNSKKSSIAIFFDDLVEFNKNLVATAESDDQNVKHVVLSNETVTMKKVENSDAHDFSIKITKQDDSGKTKMVYLLEIELDKILHEIDHIISMRSAAKET